jgi:serine O-acetyltransferase
LKGGISLERSLSKKSFVKHSLRAGEIYKLSMVNVISLISGKMVRNDYPSKAGVADFSGKMAACLFPVIEGGGSRPCSGRSLRKMLIGLLDPLRSRLPGKPADIADSFFEKVPSIKKQLEEDAAFLQLNDPAATEIDEVIMAYPGFFAILVYRMAHCLAGLRVPVIPRVMTEHAHSVTGIDIHPGATIGSEFFIDHGTGVVIGETAIIGNRVKLYQGVTIGALSVNKGMAATKRHPTIEDDVIIYAGSTILGGETIVGHDSVIGGNVWLTESVPPFSLVYHQPQTAVRDRGNKKE